MNTTQSNEVTDIHYLHPASQPTVLMRQAVARTYEGSRGETVYVTENGHTVYGHYVLGECPDCGTTFGDPYEGCDTCADISIGAIRMIER